MNVLEPFSTQSSPSRSALVAIPAMSEPAPGSLIARAHTFSPLITDGRYRDFCSAVPNLANHGEDMSVWTITLKATPPARQRAISSARTTVIQKSAPPPPYSGGYSTPRKPSSPSWRNRLRGISPRSSHSSTLGTISFSTKRRTAERKSSCSSRKYSMLVLTASIQNLPAPAYYDRSRSVRRSSFRLILPLIVFGRSSTNSTSRGYL